MSFQRYHSPARCGGGYSAFGGGVYTPHSLSPTLYSPPIGSPTWSRSRAFHGSSSALATSPSGAPSLYCGSRVPGSSLSPTSPSSSSLSSTPLYSPYRSPRYRDTSWSSYYSSAPRTNWYEAYKPTIRRRPAFPADGTATLPRRPSDSPSNAVSTAAETEKLPQKLGTCSGKTISRQRKTVKFIEPRRKDSIPLNLVTVRRPSDAHQQESASSSENLSAPLGCLVTALPLVDELADTDKKLPESADGASHESISMPSLATIDDATLSEAQNGLPAAEAITERNSDKTVSHRSRARTRCRVAPSTDQPGLLPTATKAAASTESNFSGVKSLLLPQPDAPNLPQLSVLSTPALLAQVASTLDANEGHEQMKNCGTQELKAGLTANKQTPIATERKDSLSVSATQHNNIAQFEISQPVLVDRDVRKRQSSVYTNTSPDEGVVAPVRRLSCGKQENFVFSVNCNNNRKSLNRRNGQLIAANADSTLQVPGNCQEGLQDSHDEVACLTESDDPVKMKVAACNAVKSLTTCEKEVKDVSSLLANQSDSLPSAKDNCSKSKSGKLLKGVPAGSLAANSGKSLFGSAEKRQELTVGLKSENASNQTEKCIGRPTSNATSPTAQAFIETGPNAIKTAIGEPTHPHRCEERPREFATDEVSAFTANATSDGGKLREMSTICKLSKGKKTGEDCDINQPGSRTAQSLTNSELAGVKPHKPAAKPSVWAGKPAVDQCKDFTALCEAHADFRVSQQAGAAGRSPVSGVIVPIDRPNSNGCHKQTSAIATGRDHKPDIRSQEANARTLRPTVSLAAGPRVLSVTEPSKSASSSNVATVTANVAERPLAMNGLEKRYSLRTSEPYDKSKPSSFAKLQSKVGNESWRTITAAQSADGASASCYESGSKKIEIAEKPAVNEPTDLENFYKTAFATKHISAMTADAPAASSKRASTSCLTASDPSKDAVDLNSHVSVAQVTGRPTSCSEQPKADDDSKQTRAGVRRSVKHADVHNKTPLTTVTDGTTLPIKPGRQAALLAVSCGDPTNLDQSVTAALAPSANVPTPDAASTADDRVRPSTPARTSVALAGGRGAREPIAKPTYPLSPAKLPCSAADATHQVSFERCVCESPTATTTKPGHAADKMPLQRFKAATEMDMAKQSNTGVNSPTKIDATSASSGYSTVCSSGDQINVNSFGWTSGIQHSASAMACLAPSGGGCQTYPTFDDVVAPVAPVRDTRLPRLASKDQIDAGTNTMRNEKTLPSTVALTTTAQSQNGAAAGVAPATSAPLNRADTAVSVTNKVDANKSAKQASAITSAAQSTATRDGVPAERPGSMPKPSLAASAGVSHILPPEVKLPTTTDPLADRPGVLMSRPAPSHNENALDDRKKELNPKLIAQSTCLIRSESRRDATRRSTSRQESFSPPASTQAPEPLELVPSVRANSATLPQLATPRSATPLSVVADTKLTSSSTIGDKTATPQPIDKMGCANVGPLHAGVDGKEAVALKPPRPRSVKACTATTAATAAAQKFTTQTNADQLGQTRSSSALSDSPVGQLKTPDPRRHRDRSSEKAVIERSATDEIPRIKKACCDKQPIIRYRKYSLLDFNLLKVLGKGSFGKVFLVELRDVPVYFAMKCLKKDVVLEDDDVECTLVERQVLSLGSHNPFVCKLFCTFQTESHLFFVMEFLRGGDLMFHVQNEGSFTEDRARFYGAEIVCALKFLHRRGIVYRDLKLDNVCLDGDGHIRLIDFGMCVPKVYRYEPTAFCGTPEYMAPEVIEGKPYNYAVDWWSFGVVMYEMLRGQSPYTGCDEDELFWNVMNTPVEYPKFFSRNAKDLIQNLLQHNPEERLGMPECGRGGIREHPFFDSINWSAVENKRLVPSFKPFIHGANDVSNFDEDFTKEPAALTPIADDVLATMDQDVFKEFSYTNPNMTN